MGAALGVAGFKVRTATSRHRTCLQQLKSLTSSATMLRVEICPIREAADHLRQLSNAQVRQRTRLRPTFVSLELGGYRQIVEWAESQFSRSVRRSSPSCLAAWLKARTLHRFRKVKQFFSLFNNAEWRRVFYAHSVGAMKKATIGVVNTCSYKDWLRLVISLFFG